MLNFDRLARHPRNTAFTDAVLAATEPHPFNRHLVFSRKYNCVIELTDGFKDGQMTLGFIQSLDYMKGNGGRCISWLLDLCHDHEILLNIYCDAQPRHHSHLKQSELKAWYRRKGFVFPRNGRDGYYTPTSPNADASDKVASHA